jgi:small-conductance mechanosensitive channel
MNMFQEWALSIQTALSEIVSRIIEFVPNILGAVIILILGWIVAALLEWAVENILRAVGLQTLFERSKVEDIVKKIESKKDTSGLIGSVVKWIIILVALIAAADTLKLPQVSNFLDAVLGYVPDVVGAAVILVIGAIFAHFMARVIRSSVKVAKLGFAELASSATKYAILVFTVIAALAQMGIATSFLQTFFTGFVAMLAIAGGLAFGLGGQGVAKEMLEKIRKETEIGRK